MESRAVSLSLRTRLGLLALACFSATPPVPTLAGEFSPELAGPIAKLDPGDRVSVLVHLSQRVDLRQLDAAFGARRTSRAERHADGIRLLQRASESQAPLVAWLTDRQAAGEIDGFTRHWIANLIVVRGARRAVEEIAARPDVEWIEPNFAPRLIAPILSEDDPQAAARAGGGPFVPPGVRTVGAPRVWRELGVDGRGVLVANLDTGIDRTHPALAARWRGRDGVHPVGECWLDLALENTGEPYDWNGHGTHVMGTMTGLSPTTRDSIGVAPGAEWIAAGSRFSNTGDGFINEVLTAFEWFADPDGNPATVDDTPHVIQNSWGLSEDEIGYAPCASYWWDVIDACEAIGIVTTWSAGNEGPAPLSLIVPADRATSATNSLAVGAVNATAYPWPYPIANFSSRGPSQCDVALEFRTKPDIVAPGVSVFSSIPGGGYAGNYSGTSMAGPHVAGVVALMRQVNADLTVDEVKQILLDTARDMRPDGEDNTTGHGFVDAYAAVVAAAHGFGRVEGLVVNRSADDRPVEGATITRLGDGRAWRTDAAGRFGALLAGARTLFSASLEGLEGDTISTSIVAGDTTAIVFRLDDHAGPVLLEVEAARSTIDSVGPYAFAFSALDPSGIETVEFHYRRGDESFTSIDMTLADGDSLWRALLPGLAPGSTYDYAARAADEPGNLSDWPPDESARRFSVRRGVARAFENDPAPSEWVIDPSANGATSGHWIWADPVGTRDEERLAQPEDDASPAPGTHCFITGNGPPGERAGFADVDDGCTVLMSPLLDMADADQGWVVYHHWYGEGGASQDDTLSVEVSSDGGESWTSIERVADPDTLWRRVEVRLDDHVELTDRIRLRWIACDLGVPGVTEAGLDDVSFETFTAPRPDPPDPDPTPGTTRLLPPIPNPSITVSRLRFELARGGPVTLDLFDALGRRVVTLARRDFVAGAHEVGWDGRGDDGRLVANGVYFLRLRTVEGDHGRRLEVLR